MTRDDATTDSGTARDAFIAGLAIEYRAEFVPQRLSRNAEKEFPSLNWRVTLARRGVVLSTDYTQGVGFIPGWRPMDRSVPCNNYYLREVADKGRYAKVGYLATRPLPAPSLAEVLYSLKLDADVLDYPSYEEWADNCGYGPEYGPDSRKGEAAYHACRKTAIPFRRMFTAGEWESLATHFEDY